MKKGIRWGTNSDLAASPGGGYGDAHLCWALGGLGSEIPGTVEGPAGEVGQNDVLPTKLGQFALGEVGFVRVCEDKLYLSDFNPLALLQADYIYYISSPGSQLSSVNSWKVEKIDQNNYWPNDLTCTSSSIIGREAIIWPSGFLVPGKTHGQLNVYFTDKEPFDGPHNIASEDFISQDYSYHHVEWVDVNNDGHTDAITARFTSPLIGSREKEFLWLENPGTGEAEGWTQHIVVSDATDVYFKVLNLEAGGKTYQAVISSEFFNKQLTLRYAESGNMWTDPSVIKTVVIDDSIGESWGIEVTDINNDQNVEIVISSYDGSTGSVYAYEIPSDFRTETFTRHTLASGYKANLILGQAMTPGSIQVFYKSTAYQQSGGKPYILVAGDDNGKHYILSPTSNDADDWSYENNLLQDTSAATTGSAIAKDLDGDGYSEIVAAGYSAGQVYVFSYTPQ
uniref:VCBS repeat-containing protein n=2 Tax=Timema TaxID=61471 RepID=A0A7R9JMQ7_TIMGE|nr:unnamed protein product [Timema genevievae]